MAKHLNSVDFDEVVKANPVVLVDFWAEWCGPCKMLSPAIEELSARYEGRALVAKVNVDESPDLARRFGVMSIPTVVILKDGAEVERKVGLMPAPVYAAALDKHL